MNESEEDKFDDDEEMFNTVGFDIHDSGLTSGYIWITSKRIGELPHVKFYRTRPPKGFPVLVAISLEPAVISSNDKYEMTANEKKEVFAFVIKNYLHLLTYWEKGGTMFMDEESVLFDKIEAI